MTDIVELTMKSNIILYLAGPIDLGKDVPNWRQKLMQKLEANFQHATAFDPSASYKISGMGRPNDERDQYIEYINKLALENAEVMVVVMPAGVQTVGTPIEVDMAHRLGMKIILLTDIPRGKSVYLNNRVPEENWIYVPGLQKGEKPVSIGLDYVVNKLMNIELVDA